MFETRDFHRNVLIDGNILFDTDNEVSYLDIVAFRMQKSIYLKRL